MREESARLHSAANSCRLAQIVVEESLCLQGPKGVYAYYRKLKLGWETNIAARQARFDRMLYLLSSDQASVCQFLLGHGCGPF
jgi:hypothetical protein